MYIYIIQGYFTGTGVILRLPQCQWSNPEGYGWNRSLHNPTKTLRNTKQTRNVWNCDYLVASEITLMYMGKIGRYTTQQNTAKHDIEWIIHDLYNAMRLNRDVSLFFDHLQDIRYSSAMRFGVWYMFCSLTHWPWWGHMLSYNWVQRMTWCLTAPNHYFNNVHFSPAIYCITRMKAILPEIN